MSSHLNEMPKNKEIAIDVGPHEHRIAVLENGKLEEFLVERPDQERMIGNVYLGVVEKVQQGVQAAFVNIGTEKNAFLPAEEVEESLLDDEKDDGDGDQRRRPFRRIEHVLRRGQQVLVQVTKEPIGNKGPRVSMQLSFAGRFVVVLSGSDFVGVSKKTRNFRDRRELKRMIAAVKPAGMGVIVRTIGLEADENGFRNEIQMLSEKLGRVLREGGRGKAPRLVHKDIGLAASAMRDLFTPDVVRVVVDSKEVYKEILSYLKPLDPDMCRKVFLYKESAPLFDYFGIEQEVDRIVRRKVWLKRGGYLVFDHTEALVTIDVNSGRFVGRSHEATILHTNLEAVQETARQIRLRDIGGLIIVDLIDMGNPRHREQVFQEFCRAMERDKAAHQIGRISEFGIIELTRKRVRPELAQILSEVCPTCGGTGTVFSLSTVVSRIHRCLNRNRAAKGPKKLQLEVTETMAQYLANDRNNLLKQLMKDSNSKVELFVNDEYHNDEFRVFDEESGNDLTEWLTE